METKQLGQFLRELRNSYGYTQEYVASRLSVSRQAYSHYETNRALPSNESFYKIASLYSIPADMLIEKSLLTDPGAEYITQPPTNQEIEKLLNYISNTDNASKLKHLTRKEREVIYYFENLPLKDQNEIIDILKIKLKNNT